MGIISTIYNVLVGDDRINNLLARSDINPAQPAIYEEWAIDTTAFPYMVLSFSTLTSDHWAKNETIINCDIFTYSNSIAAEDIKEAVIFALDRRTFIAPADGRYIRCYYNRDGFIVEPMENITHVNLEIATHHWRNDFIKHLVEE